MLFFFINKNEGYKVTGYATIKQADLQRDNEGRYELTLNCESPPGHSIR